MIVALALLIAGFIARRLMMPPAAHYLAHRNRGFSGPAAALMDRTIENAPARSRDNGSGEHLSDSDRRALDEVIRRKTETSLVKA